MFAHFYQNIVLKKPKIVFLLLILALLGFGYFSKRIRSDAIKRPSNYGSDTEGMHPRNPHPHPEDKPDRGQRSDPP